MDKKVLREVYSKLQSARESIAGGNVLELSESLKRVNLALLELVFLESRCNLNGHSLDQLVTLEQVRIWLNKAIMAKSLLENAHDYGDRLAPDRILCDVLNEMLTILD